MINYAIFRTGYVLCLQSVKAFLQSPHFLDVFLHQWTLVIHVDLSHHKLCISLNDQLLNSQFCYDPKPGKEPFILSCIVGCLFPGKCIWMTYFKCSPEGATR